MFSFAGPQTRLRHHKLHMAHMHLLTALKISSMLGFFDTKRSVWKKTPLLLKKSSMAHTAAPCVPETEPTWSKPHSGCQLGLSS